ncbi:hypothetical protein QA600_21115 [Natronococcus sp. A-GB1]|uniref:hypothetical protein n=1 Tax=Natronococcus sp. A-GB1 TaxID=3037648 RepID=UPI00241D6BAE|nr:hypothetical protein [Natronococcus sp. A-GB1]MDG5761827.1 hypothetical protein [Natronococcus sp. A-GB1]
MTDAGLTMTQQPPLSALATLEVTDAPVSTLWERLFEHQAIRDAFVRAVRRFATGRTISECYDALETHDVPYWLRSRFLNVARGDRREAWRLAADLVPTLGQGHSSLEDLFATAHFVAEHVSDEQPPTIVVTIDRAFEGEPRRKRETVCRLLAVLAMGFDVRVVASGRTLHWLAQHHREDLPGVSEWRDTPYDSSVDDRVDAALETLDPDGRKVNLLRQLAAEPAETLSRHALRAMHDVDRSRISQLLVSESDSLTELGLVTEFGPADDRVVELLEAGRQVLEALDSQRGRQQQLTAAVNDTGTSSQQCRVTTRPRDEGEADNPGNTGTHAPYRTTYLDRPAHAGAIGCSQDGGITFTDAPFADRTGGNEHVRYVSFDAEREDAVVAVRASGPLQYVVSLATALTSPRLLDRVLTDSRLESLDDPPALLRDARCIGALSDEVLEDPVTLREALIGWGTDLESMTAKLAAGEYEDRDRFRSSIIRSAHGLAGSIIHLFDTLGIDVVREIRVPAGLDQNSLEALATSIGISAAIQARYGAFACYRQLFESREEKRRTAPSPTVDAAEPLGTLIGSIVVRGADVHRLRPHLETALETPAEVVDDAPEFAIHVPLSTADRTASAAAATWVLQAKNLRPTREVVSLLHALCGSPYAAARALHQLAGEDSSTRNVRPDDLRYALGTLEPDRLLPDLPPTVGRVVHALLTATDRLSQREIADRAGVSTRSIRKYRDLLKALDLVTHTDDGYRLVLSFRDPVERRDPVTPAIVEEKQSLLDATDAVLETMLPSDRYGNPDDAVGGTLFWPPGPFQLIDQPKVGPWIRVAAALAGAEYPVDNRTIAMGPPIEQLSITGSAPRSHLTTY